jgi:hypothetical protein
MRRTVLGGLVAVAMLVAAPTGSAETITLGANSDADPFHSWTVPANVCNATFDLYGAEGSGGVGGARVTTTLAVTPGTQYFIYVGSWGLRGKGGYNGGGDGYDVGVYGSAQSGVGGGGATDLRTGPSLTQRVLVAGGGGGNGGDGDHDSGTKGGSGGAGGLLGADGAAGTGTYAGFGGGGGTALSGGAGGTDPTLDPANVRVGAPGTLGAGGDGGATFGGAGGGGGGGGGGLYGGGGGSGGEGHFGGMGGAGGGGGGGSSLAAGGSVTSTTGGQGKAIITFVVSSTGCAQSGDGGGQPGGGGGQTGGGADVTKPTLGALTLARHSFAAARSGAAISARARRKPRIGTAISFMLSEPSSVRFTVQRKASGRKLRGRCVKPSRAPRGERCTRWIAVAGSFSFAGKAGTNAFTFRGRIGGRSLAPGNYRLNGKATDGAGNASPVKRASFRIVAS